ncbi:hypothetical protein M569_16261, partial [Genlisea aurea]
VVVGDFNEVLSQDEHFSSCLRSIPGMICFRNSLDDCGLMDLGFSGLPFTWTNNRTHPSTVKARLDRFVANQNWTALFPDFSVLHLKFGGSDHSPILLQLTIPSSSQPNRRWRPRNFFKFERIWCGKEPCKDIIRDCWATPRSSLCPQASFLRRLQTCRQKLQGWHRATFGSLKAKIKIVQDQISELMAGHISNEVGLHLKDLKAQLKELWRLDELWWKQRSKAYWLKEGDKNNKFFHSVASQRRQRNKITRLKSHDTWIEDPADIQREFLAFYEQLFTSSAPCREAISEVVRTIPRRVTNEMNDKLIQAFTEDEVWFAVKQMNAESAPGPDGFPPLFYQNYWPIIKEETCCSVLDFLNNRRSFQKFNHTNLVMIPKVTDASEVSHFRPISLCNVIYKI